MTNQTAIWKFPLKLSTVQCVDMPQGVSPADVLDVQVQNGTICLWAMCDPDATLEQRDVYIHGTGHPFNPDGMEHVGTVQQPPYVWHVFLGSPETKNYN
jgi:hypothetical protein